MTSVDNEQLVLKANGAADMLAMIPSIAGFEPRDSLVLLAFRGTRSCGVIRFDLPTSESKPVLKRFATSSVGILCKLRGVSSVVAAIYTDVSVGDSTELPHSAYANVVGRRLRDSGFEVRELLCRASDAWGSYRDSDLQIGGRSLADVTESPVLAEIPEQLRTRHRLDGPSRVPDAEPQVRARFASQLADSREALDELRATLNATDSGQRDENEHLPDQLAPWSDLTGFFEEALEWDDDLIEVWGATFLLAVQAPPMRDAAMVQWASDSRLGEVSLEQSLRFNEGTWRVGARASRSEAAIEKVLGDHMLGIGPRPDPQRVERGITLLRELVSRAEDADRPAPLCMLGWLSWALGRGSEAGRYVDEARQIDSSYGMGELLDTILSNGMLPEWAFASS